MRTSVFAQKHVDGDGLEFDAEFLERQRTRIERVGANS